MRSQTKNLIQHELFIQDQKLKKVATYKYLGLHLDMNLTFNNYLQHVTLWCISVNTSLKHLKFGPTNSVHMQGTVSQILYLGLSAIYATF